MKEVVQNKDGHWEFVKDWFFTAEDFGLNVCISYERAAEIANQKLEKYLESCPVVWGTVGSESSSWHSKPPGTYIQENYTHKARLICIEEIVKEPCKHTIIEYKNNSNGPVTTGKCASCNAVMIAEWKAK